MVKGTGLLGIRQSVFPTVVLDRDVAFFDIDIGRAVFTHGAELDEVAIGLKLTQGEQQIERAYYIVHLGENRVFAVNHGVGSGTLFSEVDDCFRFEILDDRGEKVVIRYIADELLDGAPGEPLPSPQSIRQ